MQEYIDLYRTNRKDIEAFLNQTIHNVGELSLQDDPWYQNLFSTFPSLELVYTCYQDTLLQNSPNIYRDSITDEQMGNSRKYLLDKLDFKDKDIAISDPYISNATGHTCITVAKIQHSKIYFLDFSLELLLQRLGYLEIHKQFNLFNKVFYGITANLMMLLALFTVGYAAYEFIYGIIFHSLTSIESIFKPVIALTLGLAIFDLAKTVMEQEVVFKSYSKNSKSEYRVLIKFSITIIIAMLIEALMVVFKIAMNDYSQMLHALYLVIGVAILIGSLALFIYLTKKT